MTPKFRRLQLATPDVVETPERLFLSNNSKTGLSINVSIAKSCRPTPACMQYCYGLESRIRMTAALRKQVENYNRFEYLERTSERNVFREALGLAYEVQAQQDFLRFFGVGDLQRGSVRFINVLALEVPELAIWVSTRKFDLAAKLHHVPNLHVMLSLDPSTKESFRNQAFNLAGERGPENFIAWVQSDETPPPPWANVVFAEHHIGRRAGFTGEGGADPRTCPATIADGSAHESACEKCRFCFTSEKRGGHGKGGLRLPMGDQGQAQALRVRDGGRAPGELVHLSPTPHKKR
jgi:hypothetical protein